MVYINRSSIYIPQLDGKDLWLINSLDAKSPGKPAGYSLKDIHGNVNYKRFHASFDYSLDLIKLREIYAKVYRNRRFSFCGNAANDDRKEYSDRIINVTFRYSVKEYNRTGGNRYVKYDANPHEIQWADCVGYYNSQIVGIEIDRAVKNSISAEDLPKWFTYKDGKYHVKSNVRLVRSVAAIRSDLYQSGFICNGTKYVRWKRSSGSARVGKCLFIDERLYGRIHRWEMCGLKIKQDAPVDLAALESYISLTSSSIIDLLHIKPQNVLVIPAFESIFTDDVIRVCENEGKLQAKPEHMEITNSIWDGQSLIDVSLMGKYANRGMLLLRNRFFKSCCFNANIQTWFADHQIRDIKQLNGFTSAKSIEDIKLITTPSSIKYQKFSTIEKWFELLECDFGIVKYEKPPHFLGGKLVQTHYQLINSIQFDKNEIRELLEPTFAFMSLLKKEPAVLRHWIQFHVEDEPEITPLMTKTDVIYKMMSVTEKFCQTKLYQDFKADFLKSFTKDLKCGHVLVNGNYSTLCGNPIEMLQASIGSFDGTACVEKHAVFSKRFAWDQTLLGSRSPHPTISNVLLVTNRYHPDLDRYMNGTKEIVYINSIGENILQQLAGSDFDSDSLLLTDNQTLIQSALKNKDKFKVAVCDMYGTKTVRRYNRADQADLDTKISNNLIGDIINLAQELNTQIWQLMHNGFASDSAEVQELYHQTCKLSILSGIEIDKAKKEFLINPAFELKNIRKCTCHTNNGKAVKPKFFAHISRQKGYYNPERKLYQEHATAMDYLHQAIDQYRLSRKAKSAQTSIPFSDLIDTKTFNYDLVYDRLVKKVLQTVEMSDIKIKAIYSDKSLTKSEQHTRASEARQELIIFIGRYTFNRQTMVVLLKAIESDKYKKFHRLLFYILFSHPSASFYEVLLHSKTPISILELDPNGDIVIYKNTFSKVCKNDRFIPIIKNAQVQNPLPFRGLQA